MFGHGYAPRAVISSTDMAGCLITVLVLFGQHTRPVSFVPGTNPEETQRAMLTAILSAFSDKLPPKSSLILQIRDDEWGGMFVDLISQEVLDRSVVKVLVDDSSKQVSDILLSMSAFSRGWNMPTIFCILVLKYERVMVAGSKKMDHRYGMGKNFQNL